MPLQSPRRGPASAALRRGNRTLGTLARCIPRDHKYLRVTSREPHVPLAKGWGQVAAKRLRQIRAALRVLRSWALLIARRQRRHEDLDRFGDGFSERRAALSVFSTRRA